MPLQVPTYDAPQVSLRPLPDARVADVQPGNQLIEAGGALQSASNVLATGVARLQDKRNADQIFQAENALRTDYLNFENGLKERRGVNAWGATKDAAKWFDDEVTKRSSALENSTQREIFGRTAATLRLQSIDQISRHEATEQRVSVEESAKASMLSSISLAAANPTDTNVAATSRDDILKRMQVTSQLNGWTPERRQFEERQMLTNLHSQVIQARIDTDPDGARQYFEAHKAEIDGTKADAIGKMIETGTLRAKAQTAVDSIMVKGLNRAEALAEARKSFTGAEEDEVVQRINARYADHEATLQQAEREAADEAWDIFARSGTVSSLPVELLNRVDGRTLIALKREERARVSGSDIETDWNRYEELRTLAREKPANFAALDLRQEFGRMNPTERRALISLQDSISNPDTSTDAAGFNTQLSNAHDLLKINRQKDAEKRGRFDMFVTQQLDAAGRQLGRRLNYQERQQIIDRAMIQGTVGGSGYFVDDRRRTYELTPAEADNFVPEIPDEDRQAISAALTARGKPVTEAEIMRIFRKARGI